MSLKTRIDRLEHARAMGATGVLRERFDGGGVLTIVGRAGRVERRELAAAEVRQWVRRGAVTIARSYGQQGGAPDAV